MQLFGSKKHLETSGHGKGSEQNERLKGLVAGCLNGDRRSQKALYDSLAGRMFSLCLRYMGDRESAADVLQDGFVTLFTRLDTYSGEGSFEGWARRIFVNTALMSLRRKDALRQSAGEEEAGELPAEGAGILQTVGYHELVSLISALPPGFRTVFNMYVVEGYTHREIGKELGISETTSRSQLQRARTLLQEKIRNLY